MWSGGDVAVGHARGVGGFFNVGTGRRAVSVTSSPPCRARPAARHRIHRHAGGDPRRLQYFTESDVENLRGAGYNAGFTPLEDAVGRYVTQFLDGADRYR